MELVEDPRAQRPETCRVTTVTGSGREWICIKPVHAKMYRRKDGRMMEDLNPNADRHYFVPRYPLRNQE